MPFQQSFCYPMYRSPDQTLEELLSAAAAIGYAAVEFWQREGLDDYVAFIQAAQAKGLVIASMAGHKSLSDGLNQADNHDRIEAELRTSIDIAAAHGIPGLICFSGNRHSGQSDDQGLATCAVGLKRVAPYAEKKGVNLNVELLNSKVDHPGYMADRVDWGIALCESVGSPRVKLLFDIYHVQIMEGDLIRAIHKAAPHIGHYHTAGNPGRGQIDSTQEINYPAVCTAIEATGYDQYLGHEFRPAGDPVAALRQAFDICDTASGPHGQ